MNRTLTDIFVLSQFFCISMGLKAVLHGLGKISHPDPMILKQRAPRKSPLLINFEKKIKKTSAYFTLGGQIRRSLFVASSAPLLSPSEMWPGAKLPAARPAWIWAQHHQPHAKTDHYSQNNAPSLLTWGPRWFFFTLSTWNSQRKYEARKFIDCFTRQLRELMVLRSE